jgi:hypothetical protein
MQRYRRTIAAAIVAAGAVSCVLIGVGQTQTPSQPPINRLPLEPVRERGQSVTPAYEGWFKNADGTFTLLVGYYNRNANEIIDVPIGPNNKIEPGPADQGQPTHFLLRREYGVFGIIVPRDFGTRKLKWTIAAHGQPQSIDLWLNPPYLVNPFENPANGNTPPRLRLEQAGTSWQGPMNMKMMPTLNGSVGQPVPLSIWVEDKGNTELDPQFGRGRGARGGPPAPAAGAPPAGAPPAAAGAAGGGDAQGRGGRGGAPGAGADGGRGRGGTPPAAVTIIWTKYRGPGEIKFSAARVPFQTGELQKAETTATFAAPGEYWIRATAQDNSGPGGGGDQCCWSTGHFKVLVK